MIREIKVLDYGYVRLHNIASMVRRPEQEFDASSSDPALVARVSFDRLLEESTPEKDLKLVQYLQENKHNTPIEFTTVWLEIKAPIFVIRQFDTVRTRSKNELSGRYKELPRQWYIPEEVRGKPEGSIKQGSGGAVSELEAIKFKNTLEAACKHSWEVYDDAIASGIAPELARLSLCLNNYSVFAIKQDLHNLCNHFLALRLDEHAQWETRQYALAIRDLLYQVLPEWMYIWESQRVETLGAKRHIQNLQAIIATQEKQLQKLQKCANLAGVGTGEERL